MIWLFVLGAAGAAIVLVMSHAAKPIRKAFRPPIGTKGLGDHCEDPQTGKIVPSLLGCCLCTGCWTGLAFSLPALAYLHKDPMPWYVSLAFIPAFAAASAVVAYVLGTWLRRNDR